MDHQPVRSPSGLNRRTVLGGAGAIAAALGLGGRLGRAAAQEATPEALAGHPIVGPWNVTTPAGPSLNVFFADGTNIQGLPATQPGPNGVTFVGPQVGTWEPVSERGVHFTGVQLHSDANGVFTGTVTIDGHPAVGEDGQTFTDDAPETKLTVRDPTGTIVMVLGGDGSFPPVTATRMGVGSPGFPAATPTAATPTA